MNQPTQAEILEGAESAGVRLSPVQANMLSAHLKLVMDARRTTNLISDRSAEDALRLHIIDSLAAVRSISRCGTLVDIGSGAGFPGIPLGVAMECRVVLVESRSKRAAFLESVVAKLAPLGFAGTVERGRAEDPGIISRHRGADAVVMRAVSSLPTLVELGAPFLREGGRLVALKGRIQQEELEHGDRAAEVLGLGNRTVEEYALPGGDELRSLVVYEYVKPPSVELPRRAGRAEKSPLG